MAEENALLGAVAAAGGAVGRAVGTVFAAEKALGQTMEGLGSSSQKFKVTKSTVLQAGKIIQDQGAALSKKLRASGRALVVNLPAGADVVNQEVAAAWNSRLVGGDDTYAGRVEQYIASLQNLVDQLREAAAGYGFTEEEVTAALGAKGA
ncbi:hypothetical protein [Actinosynnema sp. NPDC020468]|uniref:hypothetical protein n=1 Tax=Actinosynnema sp. NPDC020468 TaxID=3154488 RepID=UPI0033C4D227